MGILAKMKVYGKAESEQELMFPALPNTDDFVSMDERLYRVMWIDFKVYQGQVTVEIALQDKGSDTSVQGS